jgi:hypothetical protein
MAPKKGEKMSHNESERISCPAWCTSNHPSYETESHSKNFGPFIQVWAIFRGRKVASSGLKVKIGDMESEDDLLSLIGEDWNQAVNWHGENSSRVG